MDSCRNIPLYDPLEVTKLLFGIKLSQNHPLNYRRVSKMTHDFEKFRETREKGNEAVLATKSLTTKRVYSLDKQAYGDGALDKGTGTTWAGSFHGAQKQRLYRLSLTTGRRTGL